MDAEIKGQWINALRSGDYDQGRLRLKDAWGKYCCLGVLCEIHPDVTFKESGTGAFLAEYQGVDDASVIPLNLCTHIGLSTDAEGHLITMNDAEGNSFTEIADYIEVEL